MQDITGNAKSYASRSNAERALKNALHRAGIQSVRYCIAVKEDGRFVPVVFYASGVEGKIWTPIHLAQLGVLVVG